MADEERQAYVAAQMANNYATSNIQAEKCGRFGLFLAAPPLAIGDDGHYQKTKPRVDPTAENPKEIVIGPRNILTKNVKNGPAIDSTLFEKPGYTAVGDPYIQIYGEILERKEYRSKQIESGNEKPFRPTRHVRHEVVASYEHMTDYVEIQKNFTDPENPRDIIIPPKNILTNPIKKGQLGLQVTFGGTVPYIEDDYNRPKMFAKAEREYHQSMLQDKPFSQKAKLKGLFNNSRKVLEEVPAIPHRMRKPRTAPACDHDRPFKPSQPPKQGILSTISPFPEYVEDPKKPLTRIMPVEGEEDKKKFRPTHNVKSRPTPSVATNVRNIKSAYPSVFRR